MFHQEDLVETIKMTNIFKLKFACSDLGSVTHGRDDFLARFVRLTILRCFYYVCIFVHIL